MTAVLELLIRVCALLAIVAEQTVSASGIEVVAALASDLLVTDLGGFLLGCGLGYTATRFARRLPTESSFGQSSSVSRSSVR
ncbi:CPA1 family monovalent cation:H+ antiporter [Halopiger aswanensis]|uniref:CPA1 family monovalent cation:H+ antiporter n=1 Tax=Halopiger aswanensis TaxID=148449 RepID=A0A419W0G5_9EURY|nr:CPA1 family monovalent cation:H+ antiporter [Halopiger aswanensis]